MNSVSRPPKSSTPWKTPKGVICWPQCFHDVLLFLSYALNFWVSFLIEVTCYFIYFSKRMWATAMWCTCVRVSVCVCVCVRESMQQWKCLESWPWVDARSGCSSASPWPWDVSYYFRGIVFLTCKMKELLQMRLRSFPADLLPDL